MRMSFRAAFKTVMIIICASLLLLGFAYIWHFVPAKDWTGIQPPEEYMNDEAWYAFNEITGWALIFIGTTTSAFVIFASKKYKQTISLIIFSFAALFASVLIAGLGAEIITTIIIR